MLPCLDAILLACQNTPPSAAALPQQLQLLAPPASAGRTFAPVGAPPPTPPALPGVIRAENKQQHQQQQQPPPAEGDLEMTDAAGAEEKKHKGKLKKAALTKACCDLLTRYAKQPAMLETCMANGLCINGFVSRLRAFVRILSDSD